MRTLISVLLAGLMVAGVLAMNRAVEGFEGMVAVRTAAVAVSTR